MQFCFWSLKHIDVGIVRSVVFSVSVSVAARYGKKLERVRNDTSLTLIRNRHNKVLKLHRLVGV